MGEAADRSFAPPDPSPVPASSSPSAAHADPTSLGTIMEAEMAEQPQRLGALLSRRHEIAAQVRSLVPGRLAGTVLVARGSSDQAATCGGYLLEMATRRPVTSASPSVHTLYRANIDFSGYLVVAISQSGRTPEIVEVVERAKASGARTVALTNDPSSPLALAADVLLALEAGEERAVPATKTVTAQLASFAILAQALGDIGLDDRACDELPAQVSELLADPGPPGDVAAWLRGTSRLATVARGLLYGAAGEVALKIEETSSLFATSFSAADLRHGPIAIATTGMPILAFAHPGPASDDVIELVTELHTRDANVRLAGPVEGSVMSWAGTAPEILVPVLAVVRGQQVALALARLLGADPDAPRGLTKVTVT